MRKWMFNFGAAVSLLLCMATIVLWVACHGKRGFKPVHIPATGEKYAIVLADGYLAVVGVNLHAPRLRNGRLDVSVPRQGPAGKIPFWILALVFLALPALWLVLRRPPIPPGHCRQCGYDLRATPDRCPECGKPSRKLVVLSNLFGSLMMLTPARWRDAGLF